MITARIAGDAEVLLKLGGMGPRIRTALRTAVEREAIRLTAYVKEAKLSGQVLKNRTGTLRRKINYTVQESPDAVTGRVGVKLAYAAAHEFGFEGTVTVREHLRTITQAFGRQIAPVSVVVRAHDMHMRLPERSFLRSSLRDNAPGIRDRLRAAIMAAATNKP
jgi:phage gpG-like protein